MEKPSFSVITNDEQYFQYCNLHEKYANEEEIYEEELKLLEFLIDAWDKKHSTTSNIKPIEFLKGLMDVNDLNQKDLALILDLSERTVVKILNKHKRLSAEAIRKLSTYFKVSQEAFNRPYRIIIGNRNLNSTPMRQIKTADSTKKFASR